MIGLIIVLLVVSFIIDCTLSRIVNEMRDLNKILKQIKDKL